MAFKGIVRPCRICGTSITFLPTEAAPKGAWINAVGREHHRCADFGGRRSLPQQPAPAAAAITRLTARQMRLLGAEERGIVRVDLRDGKQSVAAHQLANMGLLRARCAGQWLVTDRGRALLRVCSNTSA